MEADCKFYFYRTENLLNGKFYYGVRHSKDPENDPYLGSGVLLKEAIQRDGRENFKKTILEYFPTMEEAYKREAEIVNDSLVSNPNCYNIKYGGQGGLDGTTIIHKDTKIRRVCKVAVPKFLEAGWKQGYSVEHSISVGRAKTGYRHSEETKRKIGAKSKLRRHTEETKQRMSQSHKGNLSTAGMIWVTNDLEDRHIWPNQFVEWEVKGFRRGRKKSSTHGFVEYISQIKKVT